MHETAVAQELVEVILAEAQKRRAKPVRARMSCGQLNAVNDEVLSFAFDAVVAGTLCQGMTLEIEHKAMQAKCRACGDTYAADVANVRCPVCGSDDFELLPDAPIVLEEIEFIEGATDGQG
jgi:hydrogenase nickel incorporation protein HypA/HybF